MRHMSVAEHIEAAAAGVIARSKVVAAHSHGGLKGTFREILISELLEPWIPQSCGVGTGAVIYGLEKGPTFKGQDDIIVFDKSICPPILAKRDNNLGFYLYNSTLLRVEIKSKLDVAGLDDFIRSSHNLTSGGFVGRPGAQITDKQQTAPHNMLIALDSTISSNSDPLAEITRFNDRCRKFGSRFRDGMIDAICILNRGLFALRGSPPNRFWARSDAEEPERQLAQCVAMISSTASVAHITRQGRDPLKTLEAGIGLFVPINFNRC
jgi:hypothetical protein